MLLGNWDGGMFPGQPRRQKAIVQPRSDGCSPGASRSCQSQQPPQAREVARPLSEEHKAPARGPSSSPKLMGCSSIDCPSQSAPDTPLARPHPTGSNAQNASSPSQGAGVALNQTLLAPSRGDGQGRVPAGQDVQVRGG